MSADPFGRVAFGEPIFPAIGARWFNAVSEAAADHERKKRSAAGKRLEGLESAAVFVTVLAATPAGGTIAGHSVLSLSSGTTGINLYSDLTNRPHDYRRDPVLAGGRPTDPGEPTYALGAIAGGTTPFPGRPVVSIEPIVNAGSGSGIGRAVLAGVAVCDVEVISAEHQYCAPKPGTNIFRTRKTGTIPILHRELGTGVRKAAVLLGYNDPPPAVSRYTGFFTIPAVVLTAPENCRIDVDPGDWHVTVTASIAAGVGGSVWAGLAQYHSTTNVPLMQFWVHQNAPAVNGQGHVAINRLIRVVNQPARFAPYLYSTGALGSAINLAISAVRVRGATSADVIQVTGDGPQTPPGQGNGFVPEALRQAWEDDDGAAEGEDAVYAARLAAVGAGDNDQSIEGGTD